MISFDRLLAVMKKEFTEIIKSKSTLITNFIVPIILMFLYSSGMSTDTKNIPFVIYDMDDTKLSREYANAYINNRYFLYRGKVYSTEEAEVNMKKARANFYIEIPSGFARNYNAQKTAKIATYIDGTMPIRAQNVKGYVQGTNANYISNKFEEDGNVKYKPAYEIKSRYWYNQASQSRYVFVPGAIVIILTAMPAIMMTLSILKEKELGTITNFYATPLKKIEYLLGKQLIYASIYFISFFFLLFIAIFCYKIPLKGSFLLITAMASLYVLCTTGIGLVISSFAKTQVSGILIALIATMMPSFVFSGLLTPISSLDRGGQITARLYPVLFFMRTIIGSFTKNTPIKYLFPNFLYLTIFYIITLTLCAICLKKQENN